MIPNKPKYRARVRAGERERERKRIVRGQEELSLPFLHLQCACTTSDLYYGPNKDNKLILPFVIV
jgi:hypothetical protein